MSGFAELIRAADRRHGGDGCHVCKRHYNSGELTLVGYNRKGAVIVVGRCCRGRIRTLIGFGFWFAIKDASGRCLAGVEPQGVA